MLGHFIGAYNLPSHTHRMQLLSTAAAAIVGCSCLESTSTASCCELCQGCIACQLLLLLLTELLQHQTNQHLSFQVD
jgi:hypothetical protein